MNFNFTTELNYCLKYTVKFLTIQKLTMFKCIFSLVQVKLKWFVIHKLFYRFLALQFYSGKNMLEQLYMYFFGYNELINKNHLSIACIMNELLLDATAQINDFVFKYT